VKVSAEYFKGKKVLVTGHEGFLGSNLVRRLISCGAKVIGLDIVSGRKGSVLSKADRKKIISVRGDVADHRLVTRLIKKHRPRIIFHLAAEALVDNCFRKPLKTFSSNIAGTWSLLEAARGEGFVEAVVIASSDKAYGSHKKLPYMEEAPLKGDHPYDVSKSCTDLIARTYFRSYGLPVAVTRCGNIYGPGDLNFSRITPEAVRCAVKGETLMIRSDGKFTRDYIFVEDVIDGYMILARKLKKLGLGGEAFNFSDENPITVLELVKKIASAAGRKPRFRVLNRARYEIKDQYLSSKKARKVLGWRPNHTLKQGLRNTVDWYREALG